ncbi:hypothetical protein MUK42_09298 [Musa troglodytarum]|uniref:CLAVATA3/ESR (CLE)-related protein 25 n=1 Tax=Musa troglodytarum TaxID=320322 RepID=A0A9E7JCF6_9LILI|nr:hypothetical protein MUK42_09298 [Musa troglodytarum]
MSSVAAARRRRRRRRLIFCLMILCSVWVFFRLQEGAEEIPMFRRRLGFILHKETAALTGKRPTPLKLPPAGTDDRFNDSKRQAPSCPDPLHNR